jgi:hypothetical protein
MYQAEAASAMQTKEEVAMIVVNYYASLYKTENRRAFKENQSARNNELLISFNWRKTELFKNDLLKHNFKFQKHCP